MDRRSYTKALATMTWSDIKMVYRDSLLRWMVFVPFFYAVVLRWLVPIVRDALLDQFDLAAYYPLLVSYVLVSVPPLLFGMVAGFLLLDERDDDTLTAIRVTPMPLAGYLFYRVLIPLILSFITTLIVIPMAGLTQQSSTHLIIIALHAALEAPIVGLALVCFAENKIQGFAILKVLGTFLLIPLGAFFLQGPWQYVSGIFPHFWPAKTFWIATGNSGSFLACTLVGVLYHIILGWYFLKRFRTVLQR